MKSILLVDVVCDLSSRRELHGWEPWPYRNMILTWEQLLRAYNNFFKKTNHFPETFPKPPVYGVTDENYHIEALTSLTALKRESREMANCTEDYAGPIAYGKSYAYRLLIPERATVMLELSFRALGHRRSNDFRESTCSPTQYMDSTSKMAEGKFGTKKFVKIKTK